MDFRLCLILLLNIGPILCADWSNPAATQPKNCTEIDDPCINLWSFDPDDRVKEVYVNFDEELEKPIVIALIHCETCNSKDLEIGLFEDDSGSKSTLGPELIEITTGTFSLTINNRLDYEEPDHRHFSFYIVLQGASDSLRIAITLDDIDDNPPRVILDEIPCIIEENYAGPTNCTMSIFDPDEVNSVDVITFKLPDNVEQHFHVNLDPINGTHATATLEVKKDHELDFETMPVYYFELIAIDGGGNEGPAAVMIKVKDVNDEPPRWIDIFAMKSFNEHDDQRFTVYAIDGDLELNEKITYELECPEKFDIKALPNSENDAMEDIIVKDIDREDPEVENNSNTIKCTLIAKDSLFNVTEEINFIIVDINDNNPIIDLYSEYKQPIKLKEEQYKSLEKLFSVDDKDQGNNAQFDVTLQNSKAMILKTDFTEPFQVIPNNGYRNWDFSVSVSKPEILDYDKDTTWHKFSLIIHSKDRGENVLTCDEEIKIELINLNDEIPIFQPDENDFEVNIKETAGKDTYILNVFAKDDDIGDKVVYSLEDADYILKDQPKNGSVTIHTSRDNVFDYEKIKTVYIQINATDTLDDEENNRHSSVQQITVNVIDVNDETPRIFLPVKPNEITEHSDIDTEVIISKETVITAEDVDTDAFLIFSIIWDKCRASKLGAPIDIEEIEDVFIIETIYPKTEEERKVCSNPNLVTEGCAIGVLKVNNNVTLDYEIFDTILLSIQVEDKKQVINKETDEGMMTIILIDINDNAPIFVEDTINSVKIVVEHSDNDISIGTIKAIDIDGPEYNKVKYNLTPIGDTKPDLIDIDENTGELIVKNGKDIDADFPDYVNFLYYNVTATDSEWRTTEEIQIAVEDINDEKPFLSKKLPDDMKVTEEKKECFDVIEGNDYDRDAPHNVVTYFINDDFSDLHKMFQINSKTGELCVHGNIQWSIDNTKIHIYFTLQDNSGGKPNVEKFNFSVSILDIDNNPPILPTKPSDIQSITENSQKGDPIFKIIATDKDQPCTERTKIEYKITKILNSRGKEIKDKIFGIIHEEGPKPDCQQIANVIVNDKLTDYGIFTITIHAENPKTKENFDIKDYEINVVPFNFKDPVILSPTQTLFVLNDKQTPGKKLKTVDDTDINDFEASDNQNGKFEMMFSFEGDQSVFELLTKPNVDKNKARLTVKTKEPKGEYKLKIKAEHNGIGSAKRSDEKSITVKFVDDKLLPIFSDNKYDVHFLENKTEDICKEIPIAHDLKCTEDDCFYTVYYHILTPEELDKFEIKSDDPKHPQICLLRELDREEQDFHYLQIFASNNENPPSKPPTNSERSVLKVTVIVDDINDNPPSFSTKLFKGGLADNDKIETEIVTLVATDPDTVDEFALWYAINEETIEASNPSLSSIKNAFGIKGDKIVNLFTPTQQMTGYFTFDVNVYDSLNYTDEAVVKIHIISDKMRLSFKFNEDIDTVKSKKKDIEDVFSKTFDYACTVDDFTKKSNNTKTRANSFITEIKIHFIDDQDEPVEKEKIIVKMEDFVLVGKLSTRFDDIGLTLIDIEVEEGNSVTDEVEQLNDLLQILLIIVSVVLGTLCLILIVAFILRTRSLKKRLDAMTTNVFGSTKSDLNRVGINAPGTNRHAIEANPVWNEDVNEVNQFDTLSQTSGGSDLIGVEDKPDFQYNYHRASINPVVQQMFQKNEDNANGFVVGSNNMKKHSNDDDDEINSLPDSINKSTLF